MTTRYEQPKTPHLATVTDSAPNDIGVASHQSALCDQILFSIPEKDLSSTFVQVSIDTNTKTMSLSLTNCNLLLFGQSSTVHHSDSNLLRKSQEEADLREADCCVEQIRPMEARPDGSVEESQQKPNTSSGTGEILLDIEPSLPVIRKQGFLNGSHCEEIL